MNHAPPPETPKRWVRHGAAGGGVLMFALFLSGQIHLGAMGALWVLEAAQKSEAARPAPIEVAFTLDEAPAALLAPATVEPVAVPAPNSSANVDQKARQRERDLSVTAAVKPKPPPPVVPVPVVPPEARPIPPEQQIVQRQSITQRSEDPSVPPPPDARFVAEQNRRVQEETVARQRNYIEDSQDPHPGRSRTEATEEPGDATRTEVADRENRPGEEDTHPRPTAGVPQRAPEATAFSTPPEPARRGDGRAPGATEEAAPLRAGAPSTQTEAPSGSLVVTQAPGQGGAAQESGGAAAPRPRGQGGRGGLASSDLRVSWQNFENVFGEQQLAQERQAYAEARRSRTRGGNRERMWREFQASLENYTPAVRPGNQTALNAAASPFANYLAEMHRRIHREFVDSFIANTPGGSMGPLADRSLWAKLEIVVNRDGTVHRIVIVRSSGLMVYDYGAFAAVTRAQPYPEAPASIVSGDGRVYLHWGFYRDERHCATYNAQPYILANPPGGPVREQNPNRDDGPQGQPEWGPGVVPVEARRGAAAAGNAGATPAAAGAP